MENDFDEIHITPIRNQNGLVAFVRLVYKKSFAMDSIAIYTSFNDIGIRLVFPGRKISDREIQYFHPINNQTLMEMTKAVSDRYEEIMNKNTRRGE